MLARKLWAKGRQMPDAWLSRPSSYIVSWHRGTSGSAAWTNRWECSRQQKWQQCDGTIRDL